MQRRSTNTLTATLTGALCFSLLSSASATAGALEEIVVEASLTPLSLATATSGISLIDDRAIARNQSHFVADVLAQAPNVNFSSGASRGRFFQIRGTGERSQFIDPINPSVGLNIDGIDFSGIGNAASLFDVEKIEVLRGPQGTVFGASASAGLINIVSRDPSEVFSVTASGSLGSIAGNRTMFDSKQAGIVVNGAISDHSNARLAVQRNLSDGFVENIHLDRDDTDNIDETVARGKIHWQASDALSLKTTLLYINVDNGYDGFTLDNLRDSITHQPGFDRQRSRAIATELQYQLNDAMHWQLDIAHSDNDIDYGYDEDWTYDGFHAWGYSSFDRYQRERKTTTIDSRIASTHDSGAALTVGLYHKKQTVDLLRSYTYDSPFSSEYDSKNTALYGEISQSFNDKLTLSTGLRAERISSDFSDSLNQQNSSSATLWGGHISAVLAATDEYALFSRVSRGFKPAGVNSENGNNIPEQNQIYDKETLINVEMGINFAARDKKLRSQLTAFYQERRDAQIKQSLAIPQSGANCPCDFEDYIDNANKTEQHGIELESNYQLSPAVEIIFNAGYLVAEFDDYQRISAGAGDAPLTEDLAGRRIAQSPKYQFALGSNWSINQNLDLWMQVEGRDSYFFSNRHELESRAYQLVNARLRYHRDNWEVSLWGKNLGNEDYYVRGFGSFSNDPRDGYVGTEPYYQFGMPQEIGLSASYTFN